LFLFICFLQLAHPGNVKKGFFAAGVLDEMSEAWPDLFAMINMCKKRNTDKELCIEKFAVLYHYMDKHGHVPDDIFESHGFPVDSDENGKQVRRPVGISQEHLQRAKNLSHEVQKKLRHERKEEIARRHQNKLVEEKLKILHILEENQQCEKTLFELSNISPTATEMSTSETETSEPEMSEQQILAQAELDQFHNKKCKFAEPGFIDRQ
jgi:hypothetical protein